MKLQDWKSPFESKGFMLIRMDVTAERLITG
jgi:hypothetical protein